MQSDFLRLIAMVKQIVSNQRVIKRMSPISYG